MKYGSVSLLHEVEISASKIRDFVLYVNLVRLESLGAQPICVMQYICDFFIIQLLVFHCYLFSNSYDVKMRWSVIFKIL